MASPMESAAMHPGFKIKTTAKMMPKPLLILAVLTLCCCITTLNAFSRPGCQCLRATRSRIRNIKQIVVIPISGLCRQPEIIVIRKNGSKICVDPQAPWLNNLLTNLPKEDENSSGTALPATTDY
uniref:Chemokine interleukin-8-like domain-containing protein n=1 Tax=Monopterus albus TaxID=43700 RepID=A0A3Q3QBN4_MONAL|nr:C-X-C motif chemokine 13 isoform X2 [Monopterus albus]